MGKRSFKIIFAISLILISMFSSCKNEVNEYDASLDDIRQHNDSLFCKFHYINNSRQIEKIDKLAFSCGCMSGEINKKILFPNDTGFISFVIKKSNYDSILKKSIYISFTDSTFKKFNFEIKPNNSLEIIPHSKQIVFSKKSDQSIVIKTIKILNHSQKKIKINDFLFSNPIFLIKDSVYYINPNESLEIPIYLTSKKEGLEQSKLSFHTSDSTLDKQFINLYAIDNN
ncbi:MAG: DUF1573 domain-containing protein [Candidatus Kapabacteria bacterium]|nr:DUF1573 domain-containing protein [Candidatus Kapabacteria bacterium]